MAKEFLAFGVCDSIWELPKTGGTLSGLPMMRIILFRGLYFGPSFPFREATSSVHGLVIFGIKRSNMAVAATASSEALQK